MLKVVAQVTPIALILLALAGCATSAAPAISPEPAPSTQSSNSSGSMGLSNSYQPTPIPSSQRLVEVHPDDPATQLKGVKVVQQGSTLRLLVPDVAKTNTVGVRYVPVGTANPWDVKPVGYGIATSRDGDTLTFENYTVIPAGSYYILVVDSRLYHAQVTATISEK